MKVKEHGHSHHGRHKLALVQLNETAALIDPSSTDRTTLSGGAAANGSAGKTRGGDTVKQADAPAVLRKPDAAVQFCDRFTAGEDLEPKQMAEKLALMRVSPLKLARCMPALMMSDILGPYQSLAKLSDKPAPVIWICGDCHVGNFGVIRGLDGWAAWGVNDYDMTCKGSPAMDLDRFAFSLLSQMRGTPGFDMKQAPKIIDAFVKSYLAEMGANGRGGPKPAYLTAYELAADKNGGHIASMVARSNKVSRKEWIQKYATQDKSGNWKWVYSDKVEAVSAATAKKVTQALLDYDSRQGCMERVKRPLEVLGVAQKLQSGGSSHGQPRYFALVADADPEKPPLVLEVKQELPPPLAGWTGDASKAVASSKPYWTGNLHKADAAQVVTGQAAMGGCPNPITGHTSIDGISYLVREREQYKATLTDKEMATPEDFMSLAMQAGKALARAHGRTRESAQAIVEWAGDAKQFSANLNAFASAYADQAEADWKAFCLAHPDDGTPVPPEDPFHVLAQTAHK